MMRSILRLTTLSFMIFWAISASPQIQALFFYDKETGDRYEEDIQKGHEAQDFLFEGKPDSAIPLLKELAEKYPENGRIFYHLAAAHADKARPHLVKRNIERWLDASGPAATCLCLRQSKYFIPYLEEPWMERAYQRCWEIKKEVDTGKYRLGSKPLLGDSLSYYGMIDQELLSLPRFFEGRREQEQDSLQWENFKKALELIDTNDLPSEKELGSELHTLHLLLRHLDHKPDLQIRIGKQMIRDSSKGYSVRNAAILVDEGVTNQGKSPRYGQIAKETDEPQAIEDLEATNRRRKAIGLEPIEP